MKQRIYNWTRNGINYLFGVFAWLSLYYVVTSTNLALQAETTTKTTVVILLLLLLFAASLAFTKIRHGYYFIFVRYAKLTAWLLFGLAVIFQIAMVLATHPEIGFDVGTVHSAITQTDNVEFQGYFSQYTNNIPLLLLQVFLSKTFNTHSWLFFDLINMIMVDVSVLLNTLAVGIVKPKQAPIILEMQAIGLFFFPMILVPYTDTFVLPMVSLALCGYLLMLNARHGWVKIMAALLVGVSSMAGYFIKPSSVIPLMALILVSFTYMLVIKQSKQMLIRLGLLCLILVSGWGTYQSINRVVVNQQHIKVHRKLSVPMIHFVNIGMSKYGSYTEKDALAMAQRPKKSDKIAYSKKSIARRLKRRGFFGYLKFLIQKQGWNVSDGTFAWLHEGHFFKTSRDNHVANNWFKQWLYPSGKQLANFRFLAQLMWVLIMMILALSWRVGDEASQILQLSIIGVFMFLLIFEGGRSRYLIQALPLMMVLVGINYPLAWRNVQRLFKTVMVDKGTVNV